MATAKKKAASKKPEQQQVTPASEWIKDAKGSPLTVPSGKTCLVRKPDGMQAFMSQGMVPNTLLGVVQQSLEDKDPDKVDLEAISDMAMKNPQALEDMLSMCDAVVIHCVVEPSVEPVPLDDDGNIVPPNKRPDDDTLYVDYIDWDDKMFIFNYAMGGTKDLETFREEQASAMAGVLPG